MPNFAINSFTTGPQKLDGDEAGFITRDGSISAEGAHAVRTTMGANTLVNDGYIYSFNGGFSAIDADGSRFSLLNGPDGVITSVSPTGGTIDMDLSIGAEITNEGSISSLGGSAVSYANTGATGFLELFNSGSVTTDGIRAIVAQVGTGYSLIQNTGLISAAATTVDIIGIASNANIHILQNSGTILAASGIAIRFLAGNSATVQITNDGLISARTVGISSLDTANVQIFNTGMITVPGTTSKAVELGGGADILNNSGSITGRVDTGANADKVVNSGTINGTVELGEGGDSFKTAGNGFVSDVIKGEAGNDTIRGGAFDDSIDGGSEDDLLRGKNGEDDLVGGTGDDTLFGGRDDDILTGGDGDDDLRGGDGNDTLLGGGNKDLLIGRAGNDRMEGGAGNDTLKGGAGNDTLLGQNGRDDLTGGSGADVFVFSSTGHSAVGSNRDVIRDFETGLDQVDIDGLSNDTFAFIGNSAFSGTGDAEVRVTTNAAGNSIVRIDANGDGTTDSEILVRGVVGLDAGDFIL